jgi:hypothetical protein
MLYVADYPCNSLAILVHTLMISKGPTRNNVTAATSMEQLHKIPLRDAGTLYRIEFCQ